MITLPTIEEAPPLYRIWKGQRTRWLKGWLQTLLVHLRNPVRTGLELGPAGFTFLHLFTTMQVLSVLFHPFFMVTTAIQSWLLVAGQIAPDFGLILLGMGLFALTGGYSAYICLALAVRRLHPERQPSAALLFTLPFYWLLISLAGWRAIRELILAPFHWEKTEHGLAKSTEPANNIEQQSREGVETGRPHASRGGSSWAGW